MKKIILIIFFGILLLNLNAQRTCFSSLNIAEIQQTDSARYNRIMLLENQIQSYIDGAVMRGLNQSTIIIPVVVHIVYKNSSENISNAQIQSQIDVLNEDFRRLNADRINTPTAFAGVAADANIEFRLATIAPDGSSTTGITRTATTVNRFYAENDGVKNATTGGHSAWDTQKYLNIWVCDIWYVDPYYGEQQLLGYAQFPDKLISFPNTDGVVIAYYSFGRDGSALSPYNKGRSATHEIGHWLNLIHIWGDDGNLGCHCNGTDMVDDTPNQSIAKYSCPSFPTTDCCTATSPGIMFMNYMDYTDDACMNLFTEGQVIRMRTLFGENGERHSMLETAEYLTNEPCNTTLIQNINYPSPIYEFFGIYTSNIDGCRIEFKNVTIKSIATVNVTATDEIVLSPDFWAKEGSNVTLSITPNTSSNAPSLVPQHSSQQSVDIYPNTINNSDELIPFENIFKVYPNPNNGCFKLELPIETNSNIEIRITDIAGSIVYQTSSYTKDICIPNAQQGIYILSIIYPDNKTVFKKIIVQ